MTHHKDRHLSKAEKQTSFCFLCKKDMPVGLFTKYKGKPYSYCKECCRKKVDHIRVVYYNMMNRCYNKNNKDYKNYGGRGVTVCSEWVSDYQLFKKWCIDNGWERGLHLDKDIKSKGMGLSVPIYSPSTCSIVNPQTNYKDSNRKKEVSVTIKGVSRTLREWSEYSGINCSTLYYRYISKTFNENTFLSKKLARGKHINLIFNKHDTTTKTAQ